MTIGDFYRTNDVHQSRLKSMATDQDAQELARHLNEIFYPNEKGDKNIESSSNSLIKEILKLLGNYSFKNDKRSIHSSIRSNNIDAGSIISYEDNFKELQDILAKTKKNAENTCYQKFSTIKAELEQLKIFIDQLPVPGTKKELKISKKKQSIAKGRLEKIYNDIISYLEQQGYSDTSAVVRKNYIGTSKNNKEMEDSRATIAHRIYQLREIADFLASNPIAVPAKVYGDVLEYALGALSNIQLKDIPNKVNKMTKEELKLEELKKGVHGANTKNLGEHKNRVAIGVGNVVVTYEEEGTAKDPFSDRQGKMDVEFTLPGLPGTGKTYRISAKNWATVKETEKSPRDFGSTRVGAAILRSLGPQGLYDHFSPAIVCAEPGSAEFNQLQYSHKIAKYSLLLDILMGYSQTNNYADTVVINDRQVKEMKVFSIRHILEAVESETLKLKPIKLSIRDYDDGIGGKNWYNFRQKLSYNDVYKELLKYRASLRYLDLVNTMGGEDKFVHGKKV